MISRQTEPLLTYLKSMHMLAGYGFSIYKPGLTHAPDDVNRMLCGAQGVSHLCGRICVPFLTAVSEEALTCGKALDFRCPRNHVIFVIPLTADSCLVCGGALSVYSEEETREMNLKIERLILSFTSGEKMQPPEPAQPPIGSFKRRHGHQHVRQCRR